MPQAVHCDLFLYADDSCLVFQHKDVKEIERQLTINFSNICDWFIDNKLSIHFGEDKTKSILFSTNNKAKNLEKLAIKYKDINIQQYSQVDYLGCTLDESLTGETMAIKVIKKVNSRLKFLHRQNRYLTPPLRRLLCNVIIQPHFDYACSSWYPNLTKRLKTRLQRTQNKCIRFCLQLGNTTHISGKEFKDINWLTVQDRFHQSISSSVFKFFENKCPSYMKDIYAPSLLTRYNTRNSHNKLIQPFRKTNIGQNSISYIGPSVWNILPDNLKMSNTLNTFKHNLKRYYLDKIQ